MANLDLSLRQSHDAARSVDPDAADAVAAVPGKQTLVESLAASTGTPLPADLRRELERRLGYDLGGVRLHVGAASAAAASALHAQAFTIGQAVHFGSGSFDPSSTQGRRLIAHEVAHTVQQRGLGDVRPAADLAVGTPGDAHETEAEDFAQGFAARAPTEAVRPVQRSVVARAMIQRDPLPQPQGGPPAPMPTSTPNVEEMAEGVRRQIAAARARGGVQAVVAEVQQIARARPASRPAPSRPGCPRSPRRSAPRSRTDHRRSSRKARKRRSRPPRSRKVSRPPRSRPVNSRPVNSRPVNSRPVNSRPVNSRPPVINPRARRHPASSRPPVINPRARRHPASSRPASSRPASSRPASSRPASSPRRSHPVSSRHRSRPATPPCPRRRSRTPMAGR